MRPHARNWPARLQNYQKYLELTRLNQAEDLALLLLPALWASWLASAGEPNPTTVLLLLVAAAALRCAAWVFNDLTEAKLLRVAPDSMVAEGLVAQKKARDLFLGLCVAAAVATAALGLQILPYAPVALGLVLGYPFVKRKSFLVQIYMGTGFAWAVPMAYAAHGASPDKVTWLLFLGVLLWASAYFSLYAVPRVKYERTVGIHSLVQMFGLNFRPMVAVLQSGALLALYLAGRQGDLGPFFTLGLLVASGLVVYQQLLLYTRDVKEGAFSAYRMNIWLGIAVFCGITFHYLCLCGNG